jgi:hypothetical protein
MKEIEELARQSNPRLLTGARCSNTLTREGTTRRKKTWSWSTMCTYGVGVAGILRVWDPFG